MAREAKEVTESNEANISGSHQRRQEIIAVLFGDGQESCMNFLMGGSIRGPTSLSVSTAYSDPSSMVSRLASRAGSRVDGKW